MKTSNCLFFFELLHFLHDAVRLIHEFSPLLLVATTWSAVRSSRSPQYEHGSATRTSIYVRESSSAKSSRRTAAFLAVNSGCFLYQRAVASRLALEAFCALILSGCRRAYRLAATAAFSGFASRHFLSSSRARSLSASRYFLIAAASQSLHRDLGLPAWGPLLRNENSQSSLSTRHPRQTLCVAFRCSGV